MKLFEIPAISSVLKFAGIDSDGSFSFFDFLKLFGKLSNGDIGGLIDAISSEDGGTMALLFIAASIVFAVLTITAYINSISAFVKNDSDSNLIGWSKLKKAAIHSLCFYALMLVVCFSDMINPKTIFYIGIIAAIVTIIISLHNYDSETLGQYREMNQMNHSNNESQQ